VKPLSRDWQSPDTRFQVDPADNLCPDRLYDREGAVTLLERGIGRLRDENTADGKPKLFETLKPFLIVSSGAIPCAQAAAGLELREGAVRVAVHRVRRRYRPLLRDEIDQTLVDPAQVVEEMRALFSAFAE
jgi:RNA polymerase sigma-70 factor (ECF subfamily)